LGNAYPSRKPIGIFRAYFKELIMTTFIWWIGNQTGEIEAYNEKDVADKLQNLGFNIETLLVEAKK
jgi:hypothetical protein